MTLAYPTTFADIRSWSVQNGIDVNEARVRFAQYALLRAIGSSRILSAMLVFKGGNALDFIWQPNRSTRDLDFSADMAVVGPDWEPVKLGNLLRVSVETSLSIATEQLGVVFAVHSLNKQPPGAAKTFVTFEIKVGYALPDQKNLISRMGYNKPSPQVIPIEISLNEPICADQSIDVQVTYRLRVSTVEDIVAEKLRALLQQPIRNRMRRQDLLDIAVLVRERPEIDRSLVAEFLLRKSAKRNVPVSRAAFYDPEVARRASNDYEALRQTTRRTFVPFEEALQRLLAFVDTLPIPDTTTV